jgi:ferric-dicitrate binding protein FerR (iron transport regulator)
MNSLDRNSLEEQTRLVPRYVAGDLSRSERAEFEAWLVASPELAAEVDMERRLRRGMASANRRGWLNRAAPAHVHQDRRWQMAIAASTLVSIGLALSLALPRDDSGSTEASRVSSSSSPRLASPLTVRLGKVRSAGDVPDIKLNLADAPSELIVEPDVVVLTCENGAVELECAGGGIPQTPQYAEYEVDLVKRRGAVLAWRSARQEPAMRTELSFTLRDPGSLTAGDYDLVVRGVSPDHQEVVGRFWVQVGAN